MGTITLDYSCDVETPPDADYTETVALTYRAHSFGKGWLYISWARRQVKFFRDLEAFGGWSYRDASERLEEYEPVEWS